MVLVALPTLLGGVLMDRSFEIPGTGAMVTFLPGITEERACEVEWALVHSRNAETTELADWVEVLANKYVEDEVAHITMLEAAVRLRKEATRVDELLKQLEDENE